MAKRRLNGEGTIDYRKAKKLWRGRVMLDGTLHQIYGKTRTLVHQKLKALPSELKRQEEERRKAQERQLKYTVADYLNHWLTEVKLKWRANTYDGYETIVRTHLIPRFGHFYLNELTSDDITATWSAMLEGGYSPSVIEHCHARLTTAYNVAIDKDTWDVTSNPTLKATRQAVDKIEVNPLSSQDAQLLLDTVKDSDYFNVIHTALHTGMRRNELLALKWSDVDLLLGNISVQRSMHRSKRVTTYTPPKTKKGRRSIPLTPESWEHLTKELERQIDNGKSYGYKITDNSLVFIRTTGEPLLPHAVTHAFRKIVTRIAETQASGLGVDAEDIAIGKNHFHDLRHTHASMLYAQGVPDMVISQRLGHANVTVTMEIYTHIRPTMQRDYIRNFSLNPQQTMA